MQTQSIPAAPRIRPNVYSGRCSVCGSRVQPSAGVLIGDRRNGYDLRCADDAPASDAPTSAPASFMGIPVVQSHTYPEVSDRAMEAAIAMFVRADADGNAEALRLARELVAAVAYARGEPMPVLGTVGDKVDDRPRYQAAAAALLDSILGSPSGDAGAHGPEATAAVVAPHIDRANAQTAASKAAAAQAIAPAPRAARAPRKTASKSTAGNPFAHRIKP